MSFAVAIVGRPNVGKSTLFNRLTGRRAALVDPEPGVTRDRREGEGRIGPLTFRLVDTAGLEDAVSGTMAGRMRAQTDEALHEADVLLFVIDARQGVTARDRQFASELRKAETPVILVANKAEARSAMAGVWDAFSLGFGDPVAVSAEHGDGMAALHDALVHYAPAADGEIADDDGHRLRLAIVGRPNVGKSTLVNRLLGSERVITGPEPGLTRDAIAARWTSCGREIELVDTAGIRRRSRVAERVEKLSVADSFSAIRKAHIVVVVLDALQAFDHQDLAIVDHVEREGRGLVVVINKWDLADEPRSLKHELDLRFAELLPQVRGAPMLTMSAADGKGVAKLMPAVVGVQHRWTRRLSTADLNKWLGVTVERHPPPVVRGGRARLRYATQVGTRPPTFAVFGSRLAGLPDSYRRYLANRLRQDFDLPGIPLRLRFRSTRNPYAAT